jgi:hypothetical protein
MPKQPPNPRQSNTEGLQNVRCTSKYKLRVKKGFLKINEKNRRESVEVVAGGFNLHCLAGTFQGLSN